MPPDSDEDDENEYQESKQKKDENKNDSDNRYHYEHLERDLATESEERSVARHLSERGGRSLWPLEYRRIATDDLAEAWNL
jgi:hypothetical protein